MAKKKTTKQEEEEELDEIEDELLEKEEVLSEYPKIGESSEKDEASSSTGESDIDSEEEEEPYEVEEEPRYPDYKYVRLTLIKTHGDNDYELGIEGQSHGFCNILVKHFLKTEGVKAAAYKITGLVPPQVFIRLEDSGKFIIKDILFEAIESLREEVLEAQKLFQKII